MSSDVNGEYDKEVLWKATKAYIAIMRIKFIIKIQNDKNLIDREEKIINYFDYKQKLRIINV